MNPSTETKNRKEMHRDAALKLKDTFDWVYETSVNLRNIDKKMASGFSREAGYLGQVLNPYLRDVELEELEERVRKVEEIAQVATRVRPRRQHIKG
jgi:hypothetical protein